MAKTKISEYSTSNSLNTDINSINIDEGCAPSGINNAIREVMVHLRNWQTNASGDGATFANLVVQGTGSFTGAVTMSAGATLSGTNTLSGATVMAASLGTSASPSIYFTSDTNTGIFSPTADTVAIATGGSERVRFHSTGGISVASTTDPGAGKFQARTVPRVSTTTSSATPTINTDTTEVYGLTAQTADITSFTTNLSGTPSDGQRLWIYIVGTAARAITWGASFEASTVALPTTTVSTNRLDVGFVWNAATSKWRCVASA